MSDHSYTEKTSTQCSQEMVFEFLDGNYVTIGQHYRAWAVHQPSWCTLATRLNPCRPDVIGSAMHFTHVPCDDGKATPFGDFIPRIQALKAAGIERDVFHLGGWDRQRYDAEYPGIIPANPRCGGDVEMRRLIKAIDDLGRLPMPHDDLGIMSTIAPSYDEKWTVRWFDHTQADGGGYRDTQSYMTHGAAQRHSAAEAENRPPQVQLVFLRLPPPQAIVPRWPESGVQSVSGGRLRSEGVATLPHGECLPNRSVGMRGLIDLS